MHCIASSHLQGVKGGMIKILTGLTGLTGPLNSTVAACQSQPAAMEDLPDRPEAAAGWILDSLATLFRLAHSIFN